MRQSEKLLRKARFRKIKEENLKDFETQNKRCFTYRNECIIARAIFLFSLPVYKKIYERI